MVVVDGQGVPLGIYLEAASPTEVKLLEPTLAIIAVPRSGRGRPRQMPQRLIVDKAYDSNPWRTRLMQRGIELIVPHRQGRRRPPTQDGRKLRRYRGAKAPLESRTHLLLVHPFPAPGRALGAILDDVLGLRSSRLLAHHAETVMKRVLVICLNQNGANTACTRLVGFVPPKRSYTTLKPIPSNQLHRVPPTSG